jgi:hypothetical protein
MMNFLLPLLADLASPSGGATCACSCWGPGPLERRFAEAEAVFVGRVTDVQWDRRGPVATARIAVGTAWKWPHLTVQPPAEILVSTGQGPTCDTYFSVGEVWLIFADVQFARTGLWTGQCTGTERFDTGTLEWQRRARADAEERVGWLQRNVGGGTRPAPTGG